MQIFETESAIKQAILVARSSGLNLGFVPTMGALHEGHISLVEKAKENTDFVIVSIFVNPTQFNNPEDLKKYPRTVENDIKLLERAGVDCLFLPSVDEMYPTNYESPIIELGILERVMEGTFRPGHFQGVVEVVKRLFEIVEPQIAFFGKKDFQQVAIIKFMTRYFRLPVQIVECEIMRSPEGLALSSRNMRLSDKEKVDALAIYDVLTFAKLHKSMYSPVQLHQKCIDRFAKSELKLEYLEFVDSNTLESLTDSWSEESNCCIACYCGDVRLIDNMEI